MNNTVRKTTVTMLSSILAILALAPAFLIAAHAGATTSYSFNLVGPNTALAQNTIPGTQ